MKAEQQSEPKACPFCGAVGLDFAEGSTFRWIVASCSGCGASVGETRVQTLGQGTKEEWMADAQKDAIAAWNTRAALSHPSTPQGWKQIGWTCGDGDCGRIHESPGAEGSYAVPVYVPAPHTKETSP